MSAAALSSEETPAGESTGTVAFLARCAKPFMNGGWVFTGFHWPVLAGCVATRLLPDDLVQVYESGAACNTPAAQIPTSTTDVYAYSNAQCVQMTSIDVLHALMRRFDCAVLDASNVDLRGRVNSTAVGPMNRPRVRLPGGGGAPDAMAKAAHVVLLHGGAEPSRIVSAVEHVTAAVPRDRPAHLITRWGNVELGEHPHMRSIVDGPGTDSFLARLGDLGLGLDVAVLEEAVSTDLASASLSVLRLAADKGYEVARQAMKEALS